MFSQGFSLRHSILILGIFFTCFYLAVPPSANAQLALLTIILLATGIPHGSLDFYLEEQYYAKHQKKFNQVLFFTKYVLYMLLYAVLWFFLPNLSLVIFICITAYHFGEIDWIPKNDTLLNSVLLFIYGLFMILFMITIHIHDTAPLINVLLKNRFTIDQIITTGANVMLYCKIGFSFVIVSIIAARRTINWTVTDIVFFIMQTLLLYAICTLLPFYLGFAFYFGIWHSSLSFDIIRRQLHFTNNIHGWKQIAAKCLPFVTVAVFVLFFFAFSNYTSLFSSTVITKLIIGIAILTLPHLQVFSKAVQAAATIK